MTSQIGKENDNAYKWKRERGNYSKMVTVGNVFKGVGTKVENVDKDVCSDILRLNIL